MVTHRGTLSLLLLPFEVLSKDATVCPPEVSLHRADMRVKAASVIMSHETLEHRYSTEQRRAYITGFCSSFHGHCNITRGKRGLNIVVDAEVDTFEKKTLACGSDKHEP